MVELLVAIAILAIIVVAVANILGTASTLTTVNNKHMDANDQARTVFDRMADDFARIVRRKDVDYIFWKTTTTATIPGNDSMYFYTEGASYFDSSTFSLITTYPTATPEKNAISLVGYRVDSTGTASTNPSYYQLERLGKALSWDGGAYKAVQPNVAVFLTYPPAGNDVVNGPSFTDPTSIVYSAAYFTSTLWGAYSNSGTPGANPSAVGTKSGNFNDSTDTSYHSLGSQVFRIEYAFQLKDGTVSDKPMMVYSASISNGIPSSTITATTRPLPTSDSSAKLTTPGTVFTTIGSRWWDSTNQIGYICVDATPGYAVWHELGIQDVAAIIVTIAVIDKQGLTYIKAGGGDLKNIALVLPDYTAGSNPAYLLDPTQTTGWAYALLPGNGVSAVTGASKLPQSMISQIRLYQRHFYLNNF